MTDESKAAVDDGSALSAAVLRKANGAKRSSKVPKLKPAEVQALRRLSLQLKAYGELASVQRQQLLAQAKPRATWRRRLVFGSGILAAVSGGSTIALFTTLVDPLIAKVVAAVLAFSATGVTLVNSSFFENDITDTMYEGAAAFGGLSIQIDEAIALSGSNLAEAQQAFKRMNETRLRLFKEYDRVLDAEALAKDVDAINDQVEAQLAAENVVATVIARAKRPPPANTPPAHLRIMPSAG